MWLHLLGHLLSMFHRERNQHRNAMNFHSIRFDSETKLTILKDNIKLYLNATTPEDAYSSSSYITTIISDLKSDFKFDHKTLETLQNIELALHSSDSKSLRLLCKNL